MDVSGIVLLQQDQFLAAILAFNLLRVPAGKSATPSSRAVSGLFPKRALAAECLQVLPLAVLEILSDVVLELALVAEWTAALAKLVVVVSSLAEFDGIARRAVGPALVLASLRLLATAPSSRLLLR